MIGDVTLLLSLTKMVIYKHKYTIPERHGLITTAARHAPEHNSDTLFPPCERLPCALKGE